MRGDLPAGCPLSSGCAVRLGFRYRPARPGILAASAGCSAAHLRALRIPGFLAVPPGALPSARGEADDDVEQRAQAKPHRRRPRAGRMARAVVRLSGCWWPCFWG
jgi:hypothetical protein